MDFVEYNLDDALTAHYQHGSLTVQNQRYHVPMMLGDGVWQPIAEASVSDLTIHSFQAALQAGARLIIIGTGEKQQFLSPDVMVALVQKGVGVECMNTAAACRTLAMVQGEERRVWAWLWV